jgi:hypothetical protein
MASWAVDGSRTVSAVVEKEPEMSVAGGSIPRGTCADGRKGGIGARAGRVLGSLGARRPALAGAVWPGACSRARAKGASGAPGAPFWIAGRKDLGGSGLVGASGVRESPRSSHEPGSSREIRESGLAPVPPAPPATTAPGRPPRPGRASPGTGDQTRTVASIVNRQAERPSAQLVRPVLSDLGCRVSLVTVRRRASSAWFRFSCRLRGRIIAVDPGSAVDPGDYRAQFRPRSPDPPR